MMKAFDKPVTLRSRLYSIYFAVAAVVSGCAAIYSFGYVWWFNIKKSAILGITMGWFWGLQVACMSFALITVAFVLAAIPLVAVCELVTMHGDVNDRGPKPF